MTCCDHSSLCSPPCFSRHFRIKNRYTAPASTNPKITLVALLVQGDDRGRWKVTDGADLVGYVCDVKIGGIESCNCHAKNKSDRDTHIVLALNPMDGSTKRVIVEVTPRWRAMMAAKALTGRPTGCASGPSDAGSRYVVRYSSMSSIRVRVRTPHWAGLGTGADQPGKSIRSRRSKRRRSRGDPLTGTSKESYGTKPA